MICEQPVGLDTGECRRRLVHDDQPCVANEGAQDLDLLLVCDAKRLDANGRVVLEADPSRELTEPLALLRPVDDTRLPELDAEEDVVQHRHRRREGKLLVDERDAVPDRVPR